METTGANGSLHSSYLLVDGLDAHSVISSLSVAVHQQPTERRQQTTSDDSSADSASSGEAQEAEASAEGDNDVRAQIFIDCHLVGTVSLAGSFRTMGHLLAVSLINSYEETGLGTSLKKTSP